MSRLNNPVSVNILRREGSLKGFCHCCWVEDASTPGEIRAYSTAPASWHRAKPRNIILNDGTVDSPR